jgi:hypothetical protein
MPLTNGSGSRRPKNIRIRIRIRNTDSYKSFFFDSPVTSFHTFVDRIFARTFTLLAQLNLIFPLPIFIYSIYD